MSEAGTVLDLEAALVDVEPDAVIRLDIEGYDCPAVIDAEYRAAHNRPGVVLLTIDPDSEVAQTLSRLDAEDIDQMVETIKAGAKEIRKRAHAAVQSMEKCISYMRQMEKHVDAVGLTRIGNMLDREASDLERAKNRLSAAHGFFDREFGDR